MAQGYSVEAILSAKDTNFTSVMNNAQKSIAGLNNASEGSGVFDMVKGVAGGLGVFKLASAGIDMVTSNVGALVGEMTESNIAWQTFDGNMSMLGQTPQQIDKVQKSLSDFATASIYSASDMATTYAQMAALGVDNTEQLVKGMGGLAASAENPQQAMKTLSQQMVQALAKPEMQWADFKLMMEQAPSAMAQVAKSMGMSLDDLILGIQDGEIASKDFAQAVAEVGTNEQFSKLATTFKSSGQALDGLQETLANKLMPAFQELDKLGIKAVEGLTNMIDKIDIGKMVDDVTRMAKIMAPAFNEVGRHIGKAMDAVGKFIEPVTSGFGEIGQAVETFVNDMMLAISYVGLGEWGKAWDTVKTSAMTAFSSITTSVGQMVAGMDSNIRTLVTNIKSWFSEIDWASVFGTIGDVIGDIAGTIADLGVAVGTIFGEIKNQVVDFIQNIDFAGILDGITTTLGDIGSEIQNAIFNSLNATSWGEVGHTIMSNIGSSLGNAVSLIGDIGAQIFGWVSDKLASVDWNSLGNDIGTWVGEAIQNGIDGIKNFDFSTLDNMFKEIGNVIDELGQGLLEAAPGAIEGLAEAFGLDREFDNIKRIIDGFAKIDWSGTAGEFVESLKSAFKTAFSGFTLNDILPEIGFGHGDGTKTVLDWDQFFENISLGATGKKAYVRIPVDATLESVHVTNPNDIEAEIRSQVSGTPAEVDKKVNALLDFILDENGNLTQEVIDYMRSQNITGNVDAHTLVDYLIDNDGNLFEAIQQMVEEQMAGKTVPVNTKVSPKTEIVQGPMSARDGLDSAIRKEFEGKILTPTVKIAPKIEMQGSGGVGGAEGGGLDLSAITAQVQSQLASLQTMINTAMGTINNTILTQATYWGTSIASAMTTMNTSVASAMTSMSASVLAGMTLMSTTVIASLTAMTASVTIAMTSMTEAVTSAVDNMVQGITEGMAEAVSAVESAVSSIISAVEGLYDPMYSAGQSAGQGLADGLTSMQGQVESAASALASAANKAAQMVFDINSPSRVWRSFGYSDGEGLVDGLDGSRKMVARSAKLLAQEALPSTKYRVTLPSTKIDTGIGLNAHTLSASSASGSVNVQKQGEIISDLQTELKAMTTRVVKAIEEGQVLMLDGDAVVGGTANRMDRALGQNGILAGRHML